MPTVSKIHHQPNRQPHEETDPNVTSGNPIISTTQHTIEMIGNNGTNGTRKLRDARVASSGSTITPADTTTNANKCADIR